MGSPIAGRSRAELEGLIGFFVNTLVAAHPPGRPGPPSASCWRSVRETTLGAYAHQDLPFEKLVEELQPERDLSRSPLFQVMFALQNTPVPALALAGLTLRPWSWSSGIAKFDLSLSLRETAEGLRGALEYNTDLFDAAHDGPHGRALPARCWPARGAAPEPPVSQLPLLSEAERHQLLVEWNDTPRRLPAERAVHDAVRGQARRPPRGHGRGVRRAQRSPTGSWTRGPTSSPHLLRARAWARTSGGAVPGALAGAGGGAAGHPQGRWRLRAAGRDLPARASGLHAGGHAARACWSPHASWPGTAAHRGAAVVYLERGRASRPAERRAAQRDASAQPGLCRLHLRQHRPAQGRGDRASQPCSATGAAARATPSSGPGRPSCSSPPSPSTPRRWRCGAAWLWRRGWSCTRRSRPGDVKELASRAAATRGDDAAPDGGPLHPDGGCQPGGAARRCGSC